MATLTEWTSIPEAWLWTKLFIGMLLFCMLCDHLAKRRAKQIPKGADAWNPDGVKLKMKSDRESLSRN